MAASSGEEDFYIFFKVSTTNNNESAHDNESANDNISTFWQSVKIAKNIEDSDDLAFCPCQNRYNLI
jgi:hypothetical protein